MLVRMKSRDKTNPKGLKIKLSSRDIPYGERLTEEQTEGDIARRTREYLSYISGLFQMLGVDDQEGVQSAFLPIVSRLNSMAGKLGIGTGGARDARRKLIAAYHSRGASGDDARKYADKIMARFSETRDDTGKLIDEVHGFRNPRDIASAFDSVIRDPKHEIGKSPFSGAKTIMEQARGISNYGIPDSQAIDAVSSYNPGNVPENIRDEMLRGHFAKGRAGV